jgi:hypothetical protein
MEEILKKIARRILDLDEESLSKLIPKYRKRMSHFDPSQEWEEAVIIYFLINGYRIKNTQFNENIQKYMENLKKKDPSQDWVNTPPDVRLIK